MFSLFNELVIEILVVLEQLQGKDSGLTILFQLCFVLVFFSAYIYDLALNIMQIS